MKNDLNIYLSKVFSDGQGKTHKRDINDLKSKDYEFIIVERLRHLQRYSIMNRNHKDKIFIKFQTFVFFEMSPHVPLGEAFQV